MSSENKYREFWVGVFKLIKCEPRIFSQKHEYFDDDRNWEYFKVIEHKAVTDLQAEVDKLTRKLALGGNHTFADMSFFDKQKEKIQQLEKELQQVRSIGLEMQREVNRKLSDKLTALEKENERLAKELINSSVEHPCYQLSKDLEKENANLKEKIEAFNGNRV